MEMSAQARNFYLTSYGAWLEGLCEYQLAHVVGGGPQRLGQAAFNFLHEIRPDIADEVCATQYDPFYDDDRLYVFHLKVQELWL
jgi:hypothetical protein